MDQQSVTRFVGCFALAAVLLVPVVVLAQAAGSPFETGANAFVTFAQAIAIPFAVLGVMGLGAMAMFGKFNWGIAAGVLVMILCFFGAQQIVDWGRAIFGV